MKTTKKKKKELIVKGESKKYSYNLCLPNYTYEHLNEEIAAILGKCILWPHIYSELGSYHSSLSPNYITLAPIQYLNSIVSQHVFNH